MPTVRDTERPRCRLGGRNLGLASERPRSRVEDPQAAHRSRSSMPPAGQRRADRPSPKPFRTEEEETANGPADYALFVDGQRRRHRRGEEAHARPAERPDPGRAVRRGARRQRRSTSAASACPFLYSTNGEVIWFHDVRAPAEPLAPGRRLPHARRALQELLARDFDAALRAGSRHSRTTTRGCGPTRSRRTPPSSRPSPTASGSMLVAMATGTGKTFTLGEPGLPADEVRRRPARAVPRRPPRPRRPGRAGLRGVRARAGPEVRPDLRGLQPALPDARTSARTRSSTRRCCRSGYLTDPQPGHAFVYVCTIQRMAINLFGRQAVFGAGRRGDRRRRRPARHPDPRLRPDHRRRVPPRLHVAGASRSGAITLDHFDAIKIGLTATPAAHTTAYFTRRRLPLRVRAGRPRGLPRRLRRGERPVGRPHERHLPQGGRAGRASSIPRPAPSSSTSSKTSGSSTRPRSSARSPSPDSNRKILEELKKYADEHEERYGRFPKTLIFAANDLPHTSHADQLVDLARDVFGRGDAFVAEDHRPGRPAAAAHPRVPQPPEPGHRRHGRPADDRRRHPRPGVHRLPAAGQVPHPLRADARPRHPQGRAATRTSRTSPSSTASTARSSSTSASRPASPPSRPTSRRGRSTRSSRTSGHNRDRDYNIRCLVKRLQRIDKEMSRRGPRAVRRLHPRRRPGRLRARASAGACATDFTGTMKLLRDADVPGPARQLPAAAADLRRGATSRPTTVSSSGCIRDGAGNEYKPEDYLTAFAAFVRENPAQIEAIRILLDRPRDWSTDGARRSCGRSSRATPLALHRSRTCRRPTRCTTSKALVDIISMVKHAADEQRAAAHGRGAGRARLREGHGGQDVHGRRSRQWLDRIREHLRREPLDRPGGLRRSCRVFADAGGLGRRANASSATTARPTCSHELNEAMAA